MAFAWVQNGNNSKLLWFFPFQRLLQYDRLRHNVLISRFMTENMPQIGSTLLSIVCQFCNLILIYLTDPIMFFFLFLSFPFHNLQLLFRISILLFVVQLLLFTTRLAHIRTCGRCFRALIQFIFCHVWFHWGFWFVQLNQILNTSSFPSFYATFNEKTTPKSFWFLINFLYDFFLDFHFMSNIFHLISFIAGWQGNSYQDLGIFRIIFLFMIR